MATRKVKRFNDGGDAAGFGYGEGAGAAQGAGMGGFGSNGMGEGLGRGTGPGTEAFALGRYATGRDYDAQDRSSMNANAANAALTAQENNMRDAQNLAAYSAFDRDRSARYAAEDDAATIAKSNNDNPNPSGFANFSGSFPEGADGRAKGGMIKKYAKGGSVSSASSRGDGIAQRGKTKGRMC